MNDAIYILNYYNLRYKLNGAKLYLFDVLIFMLDDAGVFDPMIVSKQCRDLLVEELDYYFKRYGKWQT